jgi:hypothetical protein
MSKKPLAQAEIKLAGMTTLKNRRPLPDKPNTYVYDAVFSSGVDDAIGNFRHYVGPDNSEKDDGTYEVVAKVRYKPATEQINSNSINCRLSHSKLDTIRTATNTKTTKSTSSETSYL